MGVPGAGGRASCCPFAIPSQLAAGLSIPNSVQIQGHSAIKNALSGTAHCLLSAFSPAIAPVRSLLEDSGQSIKGTLPGHAMPFLS